MIKGFFVIAFAGILIGATGWLVYSRTRQSDAPTGVAATQPTPAASSSVGDIAMQDYKKIMNASSTPTSGGGQAQSLTLAGGLVVRDTTIGTGAEATDGAAVAVNYTGRLSDGTVFDSSIPRGKPFEFILGKGMVIKGWDVGIVGMKIGGKRTLIIPPAMAYGDKGAGGVIPPNATLTFDVELLAVQSGTNSQ